MIRFINISKNTIFLSDIQKRIYYHNNDIQEISLNEAKSSANFQQLVGLGQFKIVECGNSLFEKNLLRKQEKSKEINKMAKNILSQNNIIESSEKIEVKLRGHFYELGGYAKVNRNLALGLSQNGIKVQIDPVNASSSQLSDLEMSELSQLHYPVGKNAIVIESVIPTFSNMIGGKYRILYTTIEAYSVPQQFIDIANMYNEVWVISDFCKEVIQKCGYSREVYIVPDIVDNILYNENVEPYSFEPKLNDFVFISVFSWGYRKGYDALLKAYLSEFDGNDNVSLLIVSRNKLGAKGNDVIKDTIQKYINEYGGKNPAHIARCSRPIPEKDLPSFYKSSSAYVCLSRGEGAGLPYCEASLCGLPIIATNCSGQTMFLKESNSFLVNIDKIIKMPEEQMGTHYWDGQLFPSLTSNDFIKGASKTMRYVFENYKEAKSRNNILKKFIADNYNRNTVSLLAIERLKKIWNKIGVK